MSSNYVYIFNFFKYEYFLFSDEFNETNKQLKIINNFLIN